MKTRKTGSKSKNRKTEQKFRKQVLTANKKGRTLGFDAPKHLVSGNLIEKPADGLPDDNTHCGFGASIGGHTWPDKVLFVNELPEISTRPTDPGLESPPSEDEVRAFNLLHAANLAAALDTAKTYVEQAKGFAAKVYGEGPNKNDVVLKIDIVSGQITDIRKGTVPFLRKYIATQVKGVNTKKKKTKYTETHAVTKTI